MDIKWNMALLSMRADRFWKKTGKKITIQGTDVAGFDKSKVECFNCHKMGHFARECKAPRSQDRGRRENFNQGSKTEELAPKALMAIDGVGWDWSYMANEKENHALVADEKAPTEFALMVKSSSENEVFDNSLCSKACKKITYSLNTKITKLSEKLSDTKSTLYHYKLGHSEVEARFAEFKNQEIKFCEKIKGLEFKVESKDNRIKRLTKELEELKKDKEGLDSKLTDDTITDYSRTSPSVESNSNDLQRSNSSVSKNGESSSSISSKPMIKFVKTTDSPTVIKTNKVETVRKPSIKYAEMYIDTHKSPKKNQLKQRYGNLARRDRDTGANFQQLQAIVSHLEFIDVEIEQDDLNQKFLTSLALEWLMYTIVWRNQSDLDTMSLDDLYNHLKVYEPEVQKKSESNSHNMAFISSAKNNTASISPDTACAYIASQSNGSQIKYEDINQIDEDDIEEMEIKWNMALLSHSQVEARLVEFKNQEIKFYEKIRGLEFKVESKDNRIKRLTKELEELKKEKECLDGKLTVLFPPPAQVYSPPKKDMSWTGVPEFADDTITDYSRTSPSVESNSNDLQNSNSSVSENGESSSSISSKPMIKFLKAADSPTDSVCSWHMTANISYLFYYEAYDGGYVSFGQGGGKITSKGIIKTGKLEFKNVYFVKDLKYNLFSVSQIRDNKNSVLFTDSECIVLGRDFKLRDDTNVLLRTPIQHNMYSIDLNNIVPHKDLTCLVLKASADESVLWHGWLGYLNFKIMNKLVRHNLVRGLPSKCFENDHTCVACLKRKQHKAFCKTKLVHSVSKPLYTLHMDLFGPTFVSSLNHKRYCLVVTDDFSRFTWTFFLKTKDETSGILRNFITEIENLKELKIKIIRCDNGGEFRNNEMIDFCSRKGIKREFGNARTPQQNGVAEIRNKTLIEGLDNLGKFDAKGDEGYFIGYSMSSKAFRVFNKRTKRVEENLHVDFLENKLIEKGAGPNWLFDMDTLTNSMNYVPVVVAGTSSTNFSDTKDVVGQDVKKDVSSLRYIALPNWFHDAHLESSTSNAQDTCNADAPESNGNFNPNATSTNPLADHMAILTVESAVPTVSSPVPTACLDDSPEPSSNMENNISASPTPTFRIHKDHPKSQIIGPVDTLVQTRTKSKEMEEQSFIATIHHKTNPALLQFCLFSCFISQEEPKKISDALKDPSWVEAMQEELLQFKIQNVWSLVDCHKGVRPIGTK
nr:putative ribonuclease H-like domain-containing protein [Tanacetum cinerariifolium]